MTLDEILSKAVLNTCLGMGTVFLMLLVISSIIYLFRFIPQGDAAEPDSTDKTNAENDDDELAAVIMAAIMAADTAPQVRERTESPYIVRSIRRRK